MARLLAPNGVSVVVADGQADNLVGRGFRRANEGSVEAAPAPEPTPEVGPEPEVEPAVEAEPEAEPVKRGPGRPRKTN